MIKKFIDRILGTSLGKKTAANTAKAGAVALGKRVDIAVAEHGIDPNLVDERGVRVVKTLQEGGHEAYIVGGAVRDLLVGRRPKDFDVATNATPEQVKALFRRAFIIGRRFRIVHVIYGRGRDHEVVEVSTFRAYLDNAAAEAVEGNEKTSKADLAGKSHAVDASGRVLRDNVWGPQLEDAARRDFTVNAMYYDPTTQIVVDYHGGFKDVRKKLLRMIGDPETRYREDPVRILRAVRFAAKLGFTIDPASQTPIVRMAKLLENVPPSRMFDEMVKLLQTGHALASLAELRKQGLHRGVFPILDVLLDLGPGGDAGASPSEKFVHLALADTDRRVEEGRAVAPSFLLACLLWREVLDRWSAARAAGEPPFPALQGAIDAVFDARIGDISGRGKLAADMRETWMMQPRFERRVGSTPYSLIDQPRYRAAYDFLRLRADAGEIDVELADWWEDFALGSDDEREALVAAAREASHHHRKTTPSNPEPRRVATAPPGPREATASAPDAAAGAPQDDAPPRKRRRRRRKPGGDAGSAQSTAPATDD